MTIVDLIKLKETIYKHKIDIMILRNSKDKLFPHYMYMEIVTCTLTLLIHRYVYDNNTNECSSK